MAIIDPTTNYAWDLPAVGASVGTWGTLLNTIIGDDVTGIDTVVKAISDVADAALPKAGGTVTGAVIFSVAPQADTIAERTVAAGVTVDGLLIKDGVIPASGVPSLAASKIGSGTFADARIAASNVTQHQAALSIAASQLTGTIASARLSGSYTGITAVGSLVQDLVASGSLAWGGGSAIASSDNVVDNTILTATVAAGSVVIADDEEDADTVTVTGAAVGDVAWVTQSSNLNVVTMARVTSADTVTVSRRCVDSAGASLNAETLRVFVMKP